LPDGKVKYHSIKGCLSNLTLLESAEGLLLYDSGSGAGDIARLEKYMQEHLQKTPADIKLLVISHMHPDHAGGAAILRERYAIPVAAHERLDKWYAGLGGILQHRVDTYLTESIMGKNIFKKGELSYPRMIHPDHRLKDWERLPIFKEWQTIFLPGHTSHDIGLYNEKAGMTCYPDMFMNINGTIVLPVPVLFKEKMLESLQRLLDLEAQIMLPGHGPVLDGAAAAEYIKKAQKIIERPINNSVRIPFLLSHFTPELWKERRKGVMSPPDTL